MTEERNDMAEMKKALNGEENAPKCPHLERWIKLRCKAWNSLYLPSHFELKKYCNNENHVNCPFY